MSSRTIETDFFLLQQIAGKERRMCHGCLKTATPPCGCVKQAVKPRYGWIGAKQPIPCSPHAKMPLDMH